MRAIAVRTSKRSPADTLTNILARLNPEAARIMHLPDTAAVLLHDGAEPVGNKPEEFAAIIRTETARRARVIKAAGIHAD